MYVVCTNIAPHGIARDILVFVTQSAKVVSILNFASFIDIVHTPRSEHDYLVTSIFVKLGLSLQICGTWFLKSSKAFLVASLGLVIQSQHIDSQ